MSKFGEIYKDGLRTRSPEAYRELLASGQLETLAEQAAEDCLNMMCGLIEKGTPAYEAESIAVREILLGSDAS